MKPTRITNFDLQKPWLLIAIYESMFDKYFTLQKQLGFMIAGIKNNGKPARWTTEARVEQMKERIRETSAALRDIDQKIHDYIISHNKPLNLRQAS